MKKRSVAALFLLGSALLADADFGQLFTEGNKAAKDKNFAVAEAKFGEALKAAQNSEQKCNAIVGKFQAMRKREKNTAAEKFALDAVENETLNPQEIRRILNTVADSLLWTGRLDFALDLLNQASQMECPKSSNIYYATYAGMAFIYGKRNQPQAVIEVMDNVLKVREQHLANHYSAHMRTGKAYEQLGKKDEALKHYRKALECGKKIKYKFNYSPAEKTIERMSK